MPDPRHPPRSRRDPSRRRRTRAVLVVFACIVALQLLVAVISIDVLSAVRAYVTGESLYSKGQKDAQIYLIDYAQYHSEEDYQRFLAALAVPLGYRVAREELQKSAPDESVARRGMLDGGTHPADVDKGIRLFRWFSTLPWMAEPIVTWTAGDAVIQQMIDLAQKAHDRVVAGNLDAPEVAEMRIQAPLLNKRLTELESKFAAQLGEASRATEHMLLVVNLSLALLLGVTGLAFVRHSARMQAATEDEVRRRQESLQRLLDSTAEGLYGVDLEGRCTFINSAALDMLGYAVESDLLGKDIHALIHHSLPDGRPYAPAESRMFRAYRERQPIHVADEVFWRRDGTSFPVEYWSHPVIEDGQLHGAVATFFDITERVHMQAALRQGEVRIAKLVDAVTDGVITVDADDHIVLFNRAAERLFGVEAKAAIGTSVGRFFARRPGIQTLALKAEGRPASVVHELVGVRIDGSKFPVEATLSRLETDRGSLTTVVIRDVTELHMARAEREAREAIEAANRAKTEFLSRMSHELRTPLNAVLGFSQMLRLDRARPPSPEQLKRIQHIENAGAHLLALVNDVLDLSRVETGQLTVELEPIDVGTAVSDAVTMALPLATAAGIELNVAGSGAIPPEGPPSIHGNDSLEPVLVVADRLRLRQVLVNLLSNAIKYNRAGGRVALSWHVDAAHCQIDIVDNGPGMTPEKLSRLFEPFNRLGAEKSKVEGTGIGLVLSRRLAELMRGSLAVESTVGRGTVATVTLHTTQQIPVRAPVPPTPSQHGNLEINLRVLYAEDNEVNVELVRQVMSLRPEVALGVAENGAAALAMARRDLPDLMLVDMNLGDMTGIELARELRRLPATARIRLVALSADALPEQIDAALASGFESYLTKPLDFRKLLSLLDGVALAT